MMRDQFNNSHHHLLHCHWNLPHLILWKINVFAPGFFPVSYHLNHVFSFCELCPHQSANKYYMSGGQSQNHSQVVRCTQCSLCKPLEYPTPESKNKDKRSFFHYADSRLSTLKCTGKLITSIYWCPNSPALLYTPALPSGSLSISATLPTHPKDHIGKLI